MEHNKHLHYIFIGTKTVDILDRILVKTKSLINGNPEFSNEALSGLLKEREKLIEELIPYQRELNAYIKEAKSLPAEIGKILEEIKIKLKEITEYDNHIINVIKDKKEKVIKEISALADNNMRRRYFNRMREAHSKFIDIKQR